MNDLVLVLGDQLFEGLPGMPSDAPVFMREDLGLATRVKHHQQKIVLFFSAMRHFAGTLKEVTYQKFGEHTAPNFLAALRDEMRGRGASTLWAYRSSDSYFERDLTEWGRTEGIEISWVQNPMFLTSETDWQAYAGRGKRRLMGDFYQQQRRRMGLLLDENGQPVGGKWSHDEDNRKPLPKNVLPPPVGWIEPDAITQEVIERVEKEFPTHPGRARDFRYAVTTHDAQMLFDQFLVERLDRFGDYEDAIPHRERTLFHSILTPYLNSGLLTPAWVVKRTLEHAQTHLIPINSLEGFLRQIVGWREFIFWMDREYDSRPAEKQEFNFFNHRRKLGPEWWTAKTGLPPLDTCIQRALDHAYCHHIERLMVIGGAMLMCEVEPQASYDWFMEMFIDSADWVMRPNVLGMSQFADGGMFATKPYFSGSAYILKMSDYSKGPWCDVWDGMYWQFIDRNREFFRKNPRMSAIVSTVDKMDPARKEKIYSARDQFVDRITVG